MTQPAIFKVNAEVREAGGTVGVPFRDLIFNARHNDVRQHMLNLQANGYEVRNVKCEPIVGAYKDDLIDLVLEDDDVVPPDEPVPVETYASVMKALSNGTD